MEPVEIRHVGPYAGSATAISTSSRKRGADPRAAAAPAGDGEEAAARVVSANEP